MLNTLVSLVISICLLSGNPVYVVDADWSANYMLYGNQPMVYSVEYDGYVTYAPIKEAGYQGPAYFKSQNYTRECIIGDAVEYDGVTVYPIASSYKDKCKKSYSVKSKCNSKIRAKLKKML